MSYKNRANFKPLSEFIKRVNIKNKDGKVSELKGINIDKFFMPSVANVVGTDLTRYKVVKPRQFACNRMHVGRDYRLPITVSKFDNNIIVSPAYDVFEIIDTNELNPEYLMMWFSRSEFDRNCWFYTDTDVRGKLGWGSFCEIELPIPSIEKQNEIVKEYNIVINRIKLNEQLNQKLEETAQALYKHWFVDFEFPNEEGNPYKSSGGEMIYNEELDKEIPVGWVNKNVQEEFDIKIGRTPPRNELEWFTSGNKGIKWISIKDLGENGSHILTTSEELTKEAIDRFKIPIIPVHTTVLSFKMSVGKVGITTEKMLSNEAIAHFVPNRTSILSSEFIYCFLTSFNFNSLGTTSSIVNSINSKMVKELILFIPTNSIMNDFNKLIMPIFHKKYLIEKQNIKLKKVKNLLLSKMTKVEVEKEIVN